MFRNQSKVWEFNKMSLAEFLEKYWEKNGRGNQQILIGVPKKSDRGI